jgi:hypothetical protein
MEKTLTRVGRNASWFRPYIVDGKEIKRICIYKDGEILYRSFSGWLEHNKSDVIALDLVGDVKRATKENLSRKDNYLLKFSDDKNGFYQTGYTLYVYADCKKIDEIIDWEDEESIHYFTRYELSLSGVIVELDKQDERGERQYKNTEIPKIIMRGDYRSERTKAGKEIDILNERLEAEGIKLTDSQVKILMDKFKLA